MNSLAKSVVHYAAVFVWSPIVEDRFSAHGVRKPV
jgi:hypothetical protein